MARTRVFAVFALLAFAGVLAGCTAARPDVVTLGSWDEVISLETRPGVTVRFFQMTPKTAPKGIVLFLPGGEGRLVDAQGRTAGMFLPRRSRQIVEQGYLSAAIDVPSDQALGLTNRFRVSAEHIEDITRVVNFLTLKHSVPLYVIGISRGSLSAANLGVSARNLRIEGIVLASSLTGRIDGPNNDVSVWDLPLERISRPVLVLHHRDDECVNTRFAEAARLPDRLKGSPKVSFIEVLGGDPPRTGPCALGSAHGFFGKEQEVVSAVMQWAGGGAVPKRIGP